jgi:hypothetical protein
MDAFVKVDKENIQEDWLDKIVRDPNIVGKMSGHVEGSRAFNRYRQIDDDILKQTISEI